MAVAPAATEPPADALGVPRPSTAFVFALLALAALAGCSSSSGGAGSSHAVGATSQGAEGQGAGVAQDAGADGDVQTQRTSPEGGAPAPVVGAPVALDASSPSPAAVTTAGDAGAGPSDAAGPVCDVALPCPTIPNGVETCVGGSCVVQCDPRRAWINGECAPAP
jgi:hypothetical protein